MTKLSFKIVVCFIGLAVFLFGLNNFIFSDRVIISILCILAPLFLFGAACNAGWLDDLLDYVEKKENSLLK
jgi:hypothetical protein